MLTAMVHPDHGTHIVYTYAEQKACEEVGWKSDPALSRKLAGAEQPAPPADKTPAERYEVKFGKPPHHLMKSETILKELAE